MLLDFFTMDEKNAKPFYVQLYEQLREAIEQGYLEPGEKMPSIRRLAQDKALSRTTVEMAYQQLAVEGYIFSKPQSGYYIRRANWKEASKARPAPPAAEKGEENLPYDFGTDFIDPRAFDIKLWQRCLREVLREQDAITSYGAHQGEEELRAALAEYSHNVRGVTAAPERIVVGAGTQPLLTLVSPFIRELESAVGIESPGFPQAQQIFSDCGIPFVLLPGDKDGIDMEGLFRSGVRVVYINPSNRLQSGTPIPMGRRTELLEWAQRVNGLILEDDHNGELRYHARPIPALQGIGNGDRVIYIGSFSKVLLPSVRIGYMVLPQKLAERYAVNSKNYNQTASKIEQLALAKFLKEGRLEKQLRRLRKLYADKGEYLIECLQEAFGNSIRITLQETALRVLAEVDNGSTGTQLIQKARREGVRVLPFGREDRTPGRVILGFSGIEREKIFPGVQALFKAWGKGGLPV